MAHNKCIKGSTLIGIINKFSELIGCGISPTAQNDIIGKYVVFFPESKSAQTLKSNIFAQSSAEKIIVFEPNEFAEIIKLCIEYVTQMVEYNCQPTSCAINVRTISPINSSSDNLCIDGIIDKFHKMINELTEEEIDKMADDYDLDISCEYDKNQYGSIMRKIGEFVLIKFKKDI